MAGRFIECLIFNSTSDSKKQFAKSTFQKAARKYFNKLLANTVFPFLFK